MARSGMVERFAGPKRLAGNVRSRPCRRHAWVVLYRSEFGVWGLTVTRLPQGLAMAAVIARLY
jgi:hypothetical protein